MAGSSLGKDLYQEMLVILIEYSAEKIIAIKCQRCFVVRILSNMWNSSTSPFYYKYRKERREHITESHYGEKDYKGNNINHEGLNNGNYANALPITDKTEVDEEDERLAKVEKELNGMYWYDQNLFRLYVEEGSSRKVQNKTGIHYVSVSKVVRKVKEQLLKKVK